MDKTFEENMNILNRATARAVELIKKLYNLSFFDKSNYETNIKDIRFILATDDEIEESKEENGFLDKNQIALYVAKINAVIIKKSLLEQGVLLDENTVCMVLLHELIHMASTDRKKGFIGLFHEALPITYNEALTQYLALKLFYTDVPSKDSDNYISSIFSGLRILDEAIDKNQFYPESVKTIRDLIKVFGEDKIFTGFFEADARKSIDSFKPQQLDFLTDYLMVLSNSLEERMAKEELESIEKEVKAVKDDNYEQGRH